MIDADDDDEMILDTFPLSQKELHHIKSVSIMNDDDWDEIIIDERFKRMFQQSESIVFCTNPKHVRLETIVSVCGRRGDRFIYNMVGNFIEHNMAGGGDDDDSIEMLVSLLWDECYRMSSSSSSSTGTTTTKPNISSFSGWMPILKSKALLFTQNNHPTIRWKDWFQRYLPGCGQVIANAYCRQFGLEVRFPLRLPTTTAVDTDTTTEFLWKTNPACSIRMMMHNPSIDADYHLALMGLGGPWKPLYDSNHQGLSFWALQLGLLGFSGPTLLLIQTTADDIFGVYSELAWKELSSSSTAKQRHNNSNNHKDLNDDDDDSCLFRLAPQFGVYRRQKSFASQYHTHQYLNPRSNVGRNLTGLVVGGIGMDRPRIHLTVDLDERCKACSIGNVFDSGHLLSNGDETSFFTPARLQVWARADETFDQHWRMGQTLLAQRERSRQRLAKVDKREFLDQALFHNTKLFDHRDQIQGRGVDEDDLRASQSSQQQQQSKQVTA